MMGFWYRRPGLLRCPMTLEAKAFSRAGDLGSGAPRLWGSETSE